MLTHILLGTLSSDFVEIEEIRYEINKFMQQCRDMNKEYYTIEVSYLIYQLLKSPKITDERWVYATPYNYKETLFGINLKCNKDLQENEICIKYERNDSMRIQFSGFGGIYLNNEEKLPDKVQFNKKKKATTLIFDDDVIVVKQNKKDKEDYEKAFLWAYFIKKSGLSKTQASKYIEKIMGENK